MLDRQVYASLVIGLLVLVFIIRLVQKGRLDIAYCWLWLGVGAGMLLVVLKYDWLVLLSNLIGAKLPTTTLFLLSILVILMMCLQFSIVISSHRRQIRKLTQELAILAREKPSSGAAPESPSSAPGKPL